jgi:hypothetical protein
VIVQQAEDGRFAVEHIADDGTRLHAWTTDIEGLHTFRTDRGAWFEKFARSLVALVATSW